MSMPDDVQVPGAARPAAGSTPAKPAAAARPVAASKDARPQPNKPRRRFIWASIGAFLTANFLMFLRFFFPRTLFEPSTVFTIGYPSDFQLGVDERFKQSARIWVVREADRIYAIYGRCTHLGCTPDWKLSENKFKCPCHGSGYTPEGINFEGPAPRPMDRAHIEFDATGQIVVDTSRLYMWPKGMRSQFNDPGAFIAV
jgi:cytochrome b6-f complex iron-sulfur subunit